MVIQHTVVSPKNIYIQATLNRSRRLHLYIYLHICIHIYINIYVTIIKEKASMNLRGRPMGEVGGRRREETM